MQLRKLYIALLGLFLSGCQLALDLPPVETTGTIKPVKPYVEQRRLAFAGGLFDLKRGDLYVAYPYWHWSVPNVAVGFYICNPTLKHRFTRSLGYWNEDDNIFGSWPAETGVQVEETLADWGYNVRQQRRSFFQDRNNKVRAELLLSMRVINMTFNMCYVHAPLSLVSMDRSGGNGVITVEWEIYDTIREKVLGSYITQGYGHIDEPLQAGDKALFIAAAKDAAHQLAQTDWFYRIMTTSDPVDLIPQTTHAPLKLFTRRPIQHTPIRQQFSRLRKGVIAIRSDQTVRGSGFFINPEGYALTTARTVGDAKHVQITDSQGTKYRATVLRTDERRDVALIKADVRDNFVLPLSPEESLDLTETVYAVGTPRQNNYQATVTKGIIAAHRFHVHQGLHFIQASVPTAPGYSGGPLLDEYGNVLGLSQSISDDAEETHFSLFIPIQEALKALNIQLKLETFKY